MEKTKRPRPQLSCTPCRNRKLKCDRETPCGQCIKYKKTNECVIPGDTQSSGAKTAKRSRLNVEDSESGTNGPQHIFSALGENTHANNQIPSDLKLQQHEQSISDLLARIQALEHAVFKSPPQLEVENPVRQPGLLPTAQSQARPKGPGALRDVNPTKQKKESITRYKGAMHRNNLFEQFVQVQEFLPKAMKDPEIAQALKDLHRLQKATSVKLDVTCREIFTTEAELRTRVLAILPNRQRYLDLRDLYLKHWETIYRILHVPDFISRCNDIWNQDDETLPKLSTLLQLLLVVAIGGQTFGLHGGVDISFVNDACAIVQGYLDTCSAKEKQRLSTIQTWALLILLHQVYQVPAPKIWLETGNLVRHAMAIGLHQDRHESEHSSPYNGEIRRRIWATVLEFDLQASLAYGMPMVVNEKHISTGFPSNIGDRQFHRESEELPEAQDSEWTESSLHRSLAQSRSIRIQVVNTLANHGTMRRESDVYGNTKILESLYGAGLPLDPATGSAPPDDKLGDLLCWTHIWQIIVQFFRRLATESHNAIAKLERAKLLSKANDMSTFLEDLSMRVSQHGGTDTCYRISRILARRSLLQAALIHCRALVDSVNQVYQEDLSHAHSNILRTLKSLQEDLPYGDIKDLLLLAVTASYVEHYTEPTEQREAAMRQTLMENIASCKQRLEETRNGARQLGELSITPSTRALPTPSTPDLENLSSDEILGGLHDSWLADLGFGFQNDWQEDLPFWT